MLSVSFGVSGPSRTGHLTFLGLVFDVHGLVAASALAPSMDRAAAIETPVLRKPLRLFIITPGACFPPYAKLPPSRLRMRDTQKATFRRSLIFLRQHLVVVLPIGRTVRNYKAFSAPQARVVGAPERSDPESAPETPASTLGVRGKKEWIAKNGFHCSTLQAKGRLDTVPVIGPVIPEPVEMLVFDQI